MTGGGCWSSLLSDLLEQVTGRLSTDADHTCVHQVCTHWRSCTRLPAAYRPWIIAHRTPWSLLEDDDDYSIWPIRRVERIRIGVAPAGLQYCRGASHGWLALTDHAKSPTRLVLWEPLSNTQIPLPCLSSVSIVFLSGDPLTPSPSGWMAIACQPYGNTRGYQTFFCRPQNADVAWSVLYERPVGEIDSVAFHGGKLYCLDSNDDLYVYNVGTMASPRFFNMTPRMNKLCKCDSFHSYRGGYLVTLNDELLLVVLRLGRLHPSFAEVYKPEWSPDGGLLPLRERVTDLGDYSLFVGSGDTFALSAKEFPLTKRNHIYYCVPPSRNYIGGRKHHWVFVFNLETDALEEIPCPAELKADRTKWSPSSWFCPRRSFMKHQQ